jgi:hypothetical protein
MPNVEAIDTFLASVYRNQDVEGQSASYVKLFVNTVRHPVLGLAAFRHLMSFPVVKVAIPETERSRTHWLFDPRRPWKHRGFIASYIELPSPLSQYFQGSAKQNLRTRTSHAKVAGFHVRPVDSLEINDVISQVFKDKGWEEHEIEANLLKMGLRQVGQSVVAPVCVGVFVQFNQGQRPVALLHWLRARGQCARREVHRRVPAVGVHGREQYLRRTSGIRSRAHSQFVGR